MVIQEVILELTSNSSEWT